MTSRILSDKNERMKLCEKISDANYSAYGTTAKELTFKEYNQIRNLIYLPSILDKSYDISYLYSYDGFLPDYTLQISYKLPKEIKVEAYNKEEGYDFGEGRRIVSIRQKPYCKSDPRSTSFAKKNQSVKPRKKFSG